jgi:hypothetical protein
MHAYNTQPTAKNGTVVFQLFREPPTNRCCSGFKASGVNNVNNMESMESIGIIM